MEEYNTSDLKRAVYKYKYVINWKDAFGENRVDVYGKRMGILCFKDESYYDITAGNVVSSENIIWQKNLRMKDYVITRNKVIKMLKVFEEAEDFKAYEYRAGGSYQKSLFNSFIPEKAYFKSSESAHYLRDIFEYEKANYFKNDYEKHETALDIVKDISYRVKRRIRH